LGKLVGACNSTWYQSQEVVSSIPSWRSLNKKKLQSTFGPCLGLREPHMRSIEV
jgi:hypothetical protein